MAAAVNILDTKPHDPKNLDTTMRIIAEHLPNQYKNGIESPDSSDEKPLFPPLAAQDFHQRAIVEKMQTLSTILSSAENSPTKKVALEKINEAYGNRVSKHEIIVSSKATKAFLDSPSSSKQPETISSTMSSG